MWATHSNIASCETYIYILVLEQNELPMNYVVRCIWLFLANNLGHKYFIFLEWVSKKEYQGRGTPRWHIACCVLCFGLLDRLKGRTGAAIISAFVKFLQLVFRAEIDVHVGSGRLNYINGYVARTTTPLM